MKLVTTKQNLWTVYGYEDSYDDGLLSHSPFCCDYFTRRNRNMEYSEKLRNREKRRWIAQHQATKQLIYQQREQRERQQYMARQQLTSSISTSPFVRRSSSSQPQDARLQGPITFPNWRRSRTHSSSPPPDHSASIVGLTGLTFTQHTAVVHSALKEAYMGLDPNIELFAMDDSPTRPAAAAPYQHRSNSTVDNDNGGDSEQNYRRIPAPSPIRES